MMWLELYLSFLQIGLLSFGGGYAALPLIQKEIVERQAWLTLLEFVDVVTISQMTPGPIGINAATFVGTKVDGLLGASMATLGFITPSLIIIMILIVLYQRYRSLREVQAILNGLRPAIIALIGSTTWTIILVALFKSSNLNIQIEQFQFPSFVIMGISFYLIRFKKSEPILVLVLSGILSVVYSIVV
jgi:chromate transporter